MGVVLAVVGAVFFLTAALLYGGAIRSEFARAVRQDRAVFVLAIAGLGLMVISVVPIPGVTL